jgi:superfamily II DNA or RNA helicase
MYKLRDYQVKISNDACNILQRKGLVYLCCEVRTGKTLMALNAAELYGSKKVLFVTKKRAIQSIQNDFDNFGFSYQITITNNESLHKVLGDFDLVISDEHHKYGAYPKPNAVAKLFKQKYSHLPMIFLSGTPTAESHSQWYHQFWVSDNSPFKEYSNFYKWAADFVNVKVKHLGFTKVNDYSDADIKHIERRIKYFILTFTQEQSGFKSEISEMVIDVEMKPITYQIIERLRKDLVVKNSSNQVILADTAVKLQQKHLQLASGTCKFEDGSSKVIDYSKAEYIRDNFKDYKIGIFYKFKEELNMLKEILKDKLTTDLDEFNETDKWIALQFQAGKEGISLKKANYIVALNIDFSSSTYWQFRDRMTTKDRAENQIFWLFSKDNGKTKSIERMVYKSLMNKKDFTLDLYKKDFGISDKIKKTFSRINR